MTRQEANYLIIHQLYRAAIDNPDWRFSQLLQNLGVISPIKKIWANEFNLESEVLLKRIEAAIEQ